MQSKKEEENYDSDVDGDSEGDMDDEEGPKRRRPRVECIMGDRTAEDLRNHHPQRITADFKWGGRTVTLTSEFDAGNMCRAEQADCPNHFNIWMSSDSMPYWKYTGFRAWFYFAVKGVERGKNVHFHIRNMSFQRSLYASGLRPFFRVGREGKFKRIPGKLTWGNGEDGFQVNFTHQITVKDPETLTYFSFIEPWGYEDTIQYFSDWHEKIKSSQRMSDEIYFHRELLGYSLENRYMELITITANDDEERELEPKVEGQGLFPEFADGSKEAKIFSKERCKKFEDRKAVFFCARVHPGEVQASHVLNGIVNFILSKSEQASFLLENYVIKIIPLVNPDGVARGYYRLDTHNHNLNRFYLNPDPNYQPTVYQVKKAIVAQHKMGNLKLYIDLHGHASKKGCFIFGNNLKGQEQAENMLFGKLVSLNSLNFDFQECSFSEKLMTVKDGGSGLSREGSGRVGIYKATGLVNSYTLECHYQTGRRINTLTPKYNVDQLCIESEDQLTDRNSKFYRDVRTPNYTVEIFEDVGRSVCIAMLEWIEKNPITRIPTSHYKNLASIRNELIVHNCLLPYDILKDLRKDVAKERELMKVRTQKLQAQIQSKKLAEEKKAAKQKEKEEREARTEIQEKIKVEHKEQKRTNSKKPVNLKRKSSTNDLKEEGQTSNLKSTKNNPKHLNTKSPSDRFFAKIGSDILSPVINKVKNGQLRNQLAKQSNASERNQSRDSQQATTNAGKEAYTGKDTDSVNPIFSAKDSRRIESIPRGESRRQTSNSSSIVNEKQPTKSAKSASRKNIGKQFMQNMYKTDNDTTNQLFKGRQKGKHHPVMLARQRSNLSCNDQDKTQSRQRERERSFNQDRVAAISQDRSQDPSGAQTGTFNTENGSINGNGLTLFQQFVQKRSNVQGQMAVAQSSKINVEFLQKMGIPIPKEGEMIIIQHQDQIHCIDRRRPEDRKENILLNLQQQKGSPIGFMVPDVIQGQLKNPKQMPKFIGGTQFGLSLDKNFGVDEQQQRQFKNTTDENEKEYLNELKTDMKNVIVNQNAELNQQMQKASTTFSSTQNSTRERIQSRGRQQQKVLPEILDQQDANGVYYKRPNQVFNRGIKPLIRKLQKTHVVKNMRFIGKPSGQQRNNLSQASNQFSENNRFHDNATQQEVAAGSNLAQNHADNAVPGGETVFTRKVSNSVEIYGQPQQQESDNNCFLNLLDQKQKILEQYQQQHQELQKQAALQKHQPSAGDLTLKNQMVSGQSTVAGSSSISQPDIMAANTLQLKPTYNHNLFQGKMRNTNFIGQQGRFQEFSQYINRHTSPGRQPDLMPQIMAQNYRKIMKQNKQIGQLLNHENGLNENSIQQTLSSQQQLLQSIDANKIDNSKSDPKTSSLMGGNSADKNGHGNVFQNKKLQDLAKLTQQRHEKSPDVLYNNDFKSATIQLSGNGTGNANNHNRSSRVNMMVNGSKQQLQSQIGGLNGHAIHPPTINLINKHSSYNNFMVQGFNSEQQAAYAQMNAPAHVNRNGE